MPALPGSGHSTTPGRSTIDGASRKVTWATAGASGSDMPSSPAGRQTTARRRSRRGRPRPCGRRSSRVRVRRPRSRSLAPGRAPRRRHRQPHVPAPAFRPRRAPSRLRGGTGRRRHWKRAPEAPPSGGCWSAVPAPSRSACGGSDQRLESRRRADIHLAGEVKDPDPRLLFELRATARSRDVRARHRAARCTAMRMLRDAPVDDVAGWPEPKRSITVTALPRRASSNAAARPNTPPPITTTSCLDPLHEVFISERRRR